MNPLNIIQLLRKSCIESPRLAIEGAYINLPWPGHSRALYYGEDHH